ncbi:PA2169 family four-helix-bundle protein [Marinomonas algicola]|uniref:PA2169 family four-helix-bundle protein n=1 Tax=Marinomonas algicola TaxID=2773454 RepID=UPI001749917A|nr:PA2169 family four-helix-bundle protein [Marinomonas algicola]
MNSHLSNVHQVSDIIKVMNSGINFYDKAKDQIENPEIKQLFVHMIIEKERAIAELQPFSEQENGHIEQGNDIAVDFREGYAKVLDAVKSDSTLHIYVDQLEEVEDKVLEKLNSALEQPQPASCQATLRKVKVNMQQCHDKMKRLQVITET